MTSRVTFPLSAFAARLRDAMARSLEPARGETGRRSLAEDSIFNEFALELFALQFERNAVYRQFCAARGAKPGKVSNWREIPAMPTAAFKDFEVTSLSPGERTSVFHSSGTTQQRPSRHFHNPESLELYKASLLGWFEAQPLLAGALEAGRLICLTPPPAQAPNSSLVCMFDTVAKRFAGGDAAFTGTIGADGGWELDFGAAVKALDDSAQSGKPVLVLGTAFGFVQLLDHLAASRTRTQLPAGSSAMETGGYKGRSRALPKAELHAMIAHGLGVARERIVCEYGMSELSSQAYDKGPDAEENSSSAAAFHFPPWARSEIISPETGRQSAEGPGLIRIFDLANVWSVMAIQTEDLGTRRGNGFELIGRAAVAEARGCSLMSA